MKKNNLKKKLSLILFIILVMVIFVDIVFVSYASLDACGAQAVPYNYGTACTVGIGACQHNGAIGCDGQCSATPGTPTSEVCDQIDNDCDGQTDNGVCSLLSNFTSRIYDTQENSPQLKSRYKNATWIADIPANTSITVKIRTSNSPTMAGAASWSTCGYVAKDTNLSYAWFYSQEYKLYPNPGTPNQNFTINSALVWWCAGNGWYFNEQLGWWWSNGDGWMLKPDACIEQGDRYVQYMVELSTLNLSRTPVLKEMRITYSNFE